MPAIITCNPTQQQSIIQFLEGLHSKLRTNSASVGADDIMDDKKAVLKEILQRIE